MKEPTDNILLETKGIEIINDDGIDIVPSIIEEISSYCKNIQRIILVEKGTKSDPDTFYTLIQYKDDIMHGTQVTFRHSKEKPNDLKIVAVVPWRNGVVHGNAKYYYRSGSLMEIVPYVNGDVEGIYKVYKENGDLAEKIFYNKGEFNGSFLL
jgi:antitoxin component YwqK of YwqJK toxin-antitoxin module